MLNSSSILPKQLEDLIGQLLEHRNLKFHCFSGYFWITMPVVSTEIQPEPRLVYLGNGPQFIHLKHLMSCYWSFRIFPLSPNRFLLIRVKGVS